MKINPKIKCFFGFHEGKYYLGNVKFETALDSKKGFTISFMECRHCDKSKINFIYGC